MTKWRNKIKILLLGIMLLMNVGVFAQVDKLNRAQHLYEVKDIDNAVGCIDSIVRHPETKNDYTLWSLRAFIYFEKYKRGDRQKLNSPLRDSVVASVRKSMKLKPDANYVTQNKKLITTIASGYYNLAKNLLQDSIDDVKSLKAYNKYKEVFLLGDPTAVLTAKDIEYYLAVGSLFSDIFINDNANLKAQKTAKVALLKVLELQPDNAAANINLGLMAFNVGVNLSRSMGFDTDLTQADIIQENVAKLAKQAEQYILKVYKIDNANKKAVEALWLTYRMLFDDKKADEFKQKCIELGIKVD